jgi:hypothetical protein
MYEINLQSVKDVDHALAQVPPHSLNTDIPSNALTSHHWGHVHIIHISVLTHVTVSASIGNGTATISPAI